MIPEVHSAGTIFGQLANSARACQPRFVPSPLRAVLVMLAGCWPKALPVAALAAGQITMGRAGELRGTPRGGSDSVTEGRPASQERSPASISARRQTGPPMMERCVERLDWVEARKSDAAWHGRPGRDGA